MAELIIETPGMLTTVQDLGRFGSARFGMSPSGPMDSVSFRIANILVGNDPKDSALEATILGPTVRFTDDGLIAVTGADMAPKLNSRPCPRYQAVPVRSGDILQLGAITSGARTYVAFSGGIDVPLMMGSRATAVQNKVGGFEGRRLMAGDRLSLGKPAYLPADTDPRHLPLPAPYANEAIFRVVPGPQEDAFTEAGRKTFYGSTYTVSTESNRMGCRLEGSVIEHAGDGNIISDGIVAGCIQVPGSGQPIVLLQECQTVGGYAKIATVISADLSRLGQCKAGDRITFQAVTLAEAQQAYREQERVILALEERFNHSWAESFVRRIGRRLAGKTI